MKRTKESSLTRRSFLKGGVAVGSAAAIGALAGCSPAESLSKTGASDTDQTQQSDADPIPPVDPPQAWDIESDVVVVGLGGGGLAASLLLAKNGYKVAAVEKEGSVGGGTRCAYAFGALPGGARIQNEGGYPPMDHEIIYRMFAEQHHFTTDQDLLMNLLSYCAPTIDFLCDVEGTDLVIDGPCVLDREVAEGRHDKSHGMSRTVDCVEQALIKEGCEPMLNTKCETLVYNGTRVVGIKASGQDGDIFIKGDKGVILCAGGIGMNEDLVKKYIPSAVKAVLGGPMPSHTGEAFRMGLGVGSDYAGFNGFSCWEGAVDERIAGGSGEWWSYFYHGERQLFHNPWLIIDRRGKRVPYFAQGFTEGFDPSDIAGGNFGDVVTAGAWHGSMGGHAYSICDSNFPTYIYENQTYTASPAQDTCRHPNDNPDTIDPKAAGLYTSDWVGEVEAAAERGAVKKADTIEELADMLLLDRDVLVSAVDNWNKLCEKGVDDELIFPYHESWLHPVADPPFYAAIVGGQIGKTLCGLRVNESLQVLTPEAKIIPGLYANWSTAGGFNGEDSYCDPWNPMILLGGNSSTWVTGYMAASELMKLEG